MSVKEQLHALVDQLAPSDEVEALDYLEWLLAPDDMLTDDELEPVRQGEEEIAAGAFVGIANLNST